MMTDRWIGEQPARFGIIDFQHAVQRRSGQCPFPLFHDDTDRGSGRDAERRKQGHGRFT